MRKLWLDELISLTYAFRFWDIESDGLQSVGAALPQLVFSFLRQASGEDVAPEFVKLLGAQEAEARVAAGDDDILSGVSDPRGTDETINDPVDDEEPDGR